MTINPVNEGEDADLRSVSTEQVQHTGRDLNQIQEAAADGMWIWFQEPRAVHHNGTTYIGWITRDGSVRIGGYDHSADSWTRTTLDSQFKEDDHCNPSILVANNSKIWAFWSEHPGSQINYKISDSAEDVSSFGSTQTISGGTFTYPSVTQFSNGDIRVWVRDVDFSSARYGFYESTDGGSTWSSTATWIAQYTKMHQENDNVHFGITTSGHPRSNDTGIVYAKYNRSNDSFVDASGSSIGALPLSESDWSRQVWDESGEDKRAWIWDVAVANDGAPVVLFVTFDKEWTHHAYRYGKWTGSSWKVNKLTDGASYITHDRIEQQYSPGAYLDHTDPSTVFVSVGGNRSTKLQRWTTSDGGDTWGYVDITGPQQQHIRPVVPRNYHDEMRLVWPQGSYRHYSDRAYDARLVYSDGEPTTSVDAPGVPVEYGLSARLKRSSTATISGDGSYDNISWESEDYNKGFSWSGKDVYIPEHGFWEITVRVHMDSFSASGTATLELFNNTNIIDDNIELDRTPVAGGESIMLTGSVTLVLDGNPSDTNDARHVYRVKQDTGSNATLQNASVELQMQSP